MKGKSIMIYMEMKQNQPKQAKLNINQGWLQSIWRED
jgi:hypothetical protein